MYKNETGPILYITHTINLNWIKDLNVRSQTIKLLEENIGTKLPDLGFGTDFLDMTSEAPATKIKQTSGSASNEKLLPSKRDHQQREKTAWMMVKIPVGYVYQIRG